MEPVAALVLGREAQARLRDALRGRAELLVVATCRELQSLVAARPLAAAIVQLRDADGAPTAPAVRRIREGFPLVAIVAFCTVAQLDSADLLAIVRAGVSALVVQGIDDAGAALREALTSAADDRLAERAWAAVRDLVPGSARPVVKYCLASARRAPTVEEVASALGVHRKTLAGRLARAALPPPRAILGWSRLLLAARLMEERERPLEHIALALRFPGAASLRNMLRRYTGLRAREVREGGFESVLAAFLEALR